MSLGTIDDSQRQAAKVVGLAYLLALVPAIFAEFYVRARLVVADDAARTAMNIVTHERLFRLGIASNLIVFAIDVALLSALYVVLGPIHRRVALLALGWGLIETTILVIVTLADLDALRILSGAPYLRSFEPDRLQTLARLAIGAHGSAYVVGLMFAGLRSTAFCYLWLRSRLIPRLLAGWGMVASILMGAWAFSFIIFPEQTALVPAGLYAGPIFLFEVTIGFWLVIKDLKSHPAAASVPASTIARSPS